MGKYKSQYPVVDLFAGPGGLGEGFAELRTNNSTPVFRSIASVEEEKFAYQTLLLRHFYHSFRRENVPDSYYDYLASRISREELVSKNIDHWGKAGRAVLNISLGPEKHDEVRKLIKQRLRGRRKWVLVGGPPCQAYSLVGRSRRKWGPEFKGHELHFLYEEYLRLIIDHSPPVFVMENVKGLLSARVKNESVIDKIVKDLRSPQEAVRRNRKGLEYRLYPLSHSGEVKGNTDPRCFVVRAEDYGVPQARHRMFILGIRSDIKIRPQPLEKKEPPAVGQIIGNMPRIRSGVSRQKDSGRLWREVIASADSSAWFPSRNEKNRLIKEVIRLAVQEIELSDLQTSSKTYRFPSVMSGWYHDGRLGDLISHEARTHMESDLHRYLFVSSYGAVFDTSPKLADFPRELLPAHKNVQAGCQGKMFSDRFRVQVKSKVSRTVTSHISKDGHYFIHYDPAQCRSLSVREAARLQTFPDNYFFEGPRTAQYHQVGNAVPPYLAVQIAEIVKDVLDRMPEG